MLAAGLDGVANKANPGEPNTGNLYELSEAEVAQRGIRQLPATLLDAVRILKTDAVMQDWLGQGVGESYVGLLREDEDRGVHGIPRRCLGLGAKALPDGVLAAACP